MVFQGASALNLDAKGCMSMMDKYRDVLLVEGGGRITITNTMTTDACCYFLVLSGVWHAFMCYAVFHG